MWVLSCIIEPMSQSPSSQRPGEVLGLRPETWDVIGTLATTLAFLVAAAAAFVAYRQLRQTAEARLDQNRPYVLVRVESSPISLHLIDLLIENVGVAPARNVTLDIDPPLVRAKEVDEYPIAQSRLLTAPISQLPPGFSLRTFFDSAIERHGADVPTAHDVTVTYEDGHGHSWTEHSVLDFTLLKGLLVTETYNVHHIAKALQETNKLLKQSELLRGDVVNAVVESREDFVARQRALREKHEQAMAEWEVRAKAQREAQAKKANEPGDESAPAP